MLSNAVVWSIAGSDCTGGAGIQADLKTIHSLGAEACTVITAVTAQNSVGVIDINAVTIDVLQSQLNALELEKPAHVIKIGLLANIEQIELVAAKITQYKQNWDIAPVVVYDPVAVASNGGNLTEVDILPAVKQHLLPVVDVLTPNNKELQQLTGVYVFSWDCMENAAQQALNLGPSSVILKGGHIEVDDRYCVDYCHDGYQHYWLASERFETEHTHGSGCTFASALSALMAQGYLLRDAFTIAKAYINQGLRHAVDYEGPYGPIWQGPWPQEKRDYPRVLVANSPLAFDLDWQPAISTNQAAPFASGFSPVDEHNLGLYPVIDSLSWLQRLLEAGVRTIQYREKHLTDKALDVAIADAVKLGKHYNARLFINDHWQLAIKHQAYGIHLGQEDIQSADLNAIKDAGIKLGISTHGHYEMLKIAEYQPSYLAVGAIFPTLTKDMTGQIQGVDTLNKLVNLNPEIPMVAIGGISLARAPEVAATGVGSIAVVTAITQAENPEQAVADFNQIIKQAQSHD